MLKGKEVISDPQRQYEIARQVHHKSHGGINKTTAAIAEAYHWVRIKETVSQVIRNCPECSEMNKGLMNARYNALNQRLIQQQTSPQPHLSHPPILPPGYQPDERVREDSPSSQLQLEAAQHQAQHTPGQAYSAVPQYNGFEMPLDPALMDGINETTNLEDLPPSPFLAAGRGLPPVPDLPPPFSRTTSDDTSISGVEERAPTAREEIRRRLTRARNAAK